MPKTSKPSDAVVIFDGVWKKYRRGERNDSLRDLLPALAKGMVGLGRAHDGAIDVGVNEFWAVQDVSFAVRPGEALGIIGPNGAGKSTVLKLLTKILKPTRGFCATRGRVGALIEVAAGFHPDLTGRENVFLQGAIMGMKRAEIARKMDEIVAFAEVEDFIDTQVKRYSSGMSARLGFSIAAHLDPDVLIIDEVLSVGDMPFQRRCVDRMQEFKARGVAIVFVSHNLQAVMDLCDRALYLHRSARALGPTAEVMEQYVASTERDRVLPRRGEVEIVRAQLLDSRGVPVTAAEPGDELTLRVNYVAHQTISNLNFGFSALRSTDRLVAYDGTLAGEELGLETLEPGEQCVVDFTFRVNLARGQYHLACNVLHAPTWRFLSHLLPAGILTVRETRTYGGVANLELDAQVVERYRTGVEVRA
ncbi:MAG TPA: ABC transporter ATP-binding protein [Gemmatimonadaceae bacterium]|nr:ABC transporter ATP-binding protein [Gemmatimonadaceae bacterium]